MLVLPLRDGLKRFGRSWWDICDFGWFLAVLGRSSAVLREDLCDLNEYMLFPPVPG